MEYSQNSNVSTELVVGIIGPIGCNRELVIETITDLARHFSYKVELIRVSAIIRKYVSVNIDDNNQYDRVMKLMDAGNYLRERSCDNSILGKMSAVEISEKRKNQSDMRVIYIINSLKHPEEVSALRDIYGNGFYLFAIHSDEKMRDAFLERHCHIEDRHLRSALIERDKDEDVGYGQSTSSAFHLADFFLTENGDHSKVWNSLERYFDLIFGNPFRPPTFQEYAMFMAYAASIKSADLSRQVGAVIADGTDIISSGANECPRAFGGTYWPEFNPETKEIYDHEGGRDYKRGLDHNAYEKERIVNTILQDIPEGLSSTLKKNIKESGLGDITEYGRVVHAEMDAILGCSRRNSSTKGATMFCTTYPCHNCAKHIVASGIDTVIYIEPYPKSKALLMHSDSITDDNSLPRDKVLFRPFVGVGPRQYINFFSLHLSAGNKLRRKKKGSSAKAEWQKKGAFPRVKMFSKSYIDIENILKDEIQEQVKNFDRMANTAN